MSRSSRKTSGLRSNSSSLVFGAFDFTNSHEFPTIGLIMMWYPAMQKLSVTLRKQRQNGFAKIPSSLKISGLLEISSRLCGCSWGLTDFREFSTVFNLCVESRNSNMLREIAIVALERIFKGAQVSKIFLITQDFVTGIQFSMEYYVLPRIAYGCLNLCVELLCFCNSRQ